MNKAKRLLQLPAAIFYSARTFAFGKDAKDRQNRAAMAGWFGELPEPTSPGGFGHHMKNSLTEYVRSDPKRAAKAGSFVIVVLVVALAVASTLLAWG